MSENQFSVGEKATHFIIDEVAKANTNFRQVLRQESFPNSLR